MVFGSTGSVSTLPNRSRPDTASKNRRTPSVSITIDLPSGEKTGSDPVIPQPASAFQRTRPCCVSRRFTIPSPAATVTMLWLSGANAATRPGTLTRCSAVVRSQTTVPAAISGTASSRPSGENRRGNALPFRPGRSVPRPCFRSQSVMPWLWAVAARVLPSGENASE